MSTTPDMKPDIEALLRAALTARAELVQPEDLDPLAPVVEVQPRWKSPWVLLATAAVLVLILGALFQGVGGRQRSDDLAPKPDDPQVELELPADIGRDWQADDLSTPARLDLDGDGVREKVDFLAEPTEDLDGRVRLQTTLSTTGEDAYGIAELGTTIGTSALDPIDADDDGDQELVLYFDDVTAVGGGGYPLVFDLRDGLLVQAVAEDPRLLVRGAVPVAADGGEYYDMVRVHDYWVEDDTLFSSRSRSEFATGNMTTIRPQTYVVDVWTWAMDESGVLRPTAACGMVDGTGGRGSCRQGAIDDLPLVADVATDTFGLGEQSDFGDQRTGFVARIEAASGPRLVVETRGRVLDFELPVDDPRISTTQPTAVFSDGVSFVVTSDADPAYVRVVYSDGDRMRALEPVGEVELVNDDSHRTWLTRDGTLVTAVAGDDGAWQVWFWNMVSRTEMTAFPGAVICFGDPDDPSSLGRC